MKLLTSTCSSNIVSEQVASAASFSFSFFFLAVIRVFSLA